MVDQIEPSFSLINEPWILARFRDGKTREVSLRETFAQASDIIDLVGEIPTQTFAIIRLLLAILQASQRPVRDPEREWQYFWESEEPLLEAVDSYLEHHRDRFDLLHTVQPFYQVAGLSTLSGDAAPLDKLIADIPNGEPFFTTRLKSGIDRLSFAEAARWVVHCQAFDPSGIKAGAVNDPRTKGGKGYPIGVAWAGSLGGVLIEGNDLRETLILNLVLADVDGEPFADNDVPVWEREPLTASTENRAGPTGPVDLYTWSSRRIRLVTDGQDVVGVIISNGDPLKAQTVPRLHNLEPMTAWRRSETQEKALKVGRIYMPSTHRPERAMWRGLAALLPQTVREEQVRRGSKSLPPLSFEWIGRMIDSGILGTDFILRTRAVGMKYGSQSATVEEIVDDALSMSSVLLARRGERLSRLAIGAVEQTEAAVFQLGVLARNLAIAQGGNPDGPGERLREQAYFDLDAQFRSWLSCLSDATDVLGARDDWYETARGILITLARQAVDDSGTAAWVGRINVRTGRAVSSAEAFGWFLREVHRALPEQEAEQSEKNEDKVKVSL